MHEPTRVEEDISGKVSTTIRASPEEIVAYQWDFLAHHHET